MKIFVLCSSYPNDSNPQSGIFIHNQCKALSGIGFKIIVLCSSGLNYKSWFSIKMNEVKKYKFEGIQVYRNYYRAIKSSTFPGLAINSYLKKAKNLFQEAVENYGIPDFLHAHFTFPSGNHSIFLQDSLHPLIQKKLAEVINNSKAFICVSEVLKEAVLKWAPTDEKILVVPNIIGDEYKYKPLPSLDRFIFFSAGNLIKSKNYSALISCFCKAIFPKQG